MCPLVKLAKFQPKFFKEKMNNEVIMEVFQWPEVRKQNHKNCLISIFGFL
jgi:hypothetical protein